MGLEHRDRYVLTGSSHAYNETEHAGPSYRPFLRLFAKSVLGQFGDDVRVADLGSGKGEAADYLEEMYDLRTVRLDLSQIGLSINRGVRVRALVEQLPFQSGTLQGIHMKDTLVHVRNKPAFFKECARVLEPNASMLLTTAMVNGLPRVIVNFEDRHKHVPFRDMRHHAQVVDRYAAKPSVRSVSPPYFPLSRLSILYAVQASGLQVKQIYSWNPQEPDWYESKAVARDIYMIKK